MIFQILFLYLIVINAISLLLMLTDKLRATKNLWRIPEATLLWLAVLGGSLGCLMGMRFFRHKTLKPKFFIGVPVILVLHIVAAIAVSIYL